jgi:hypothetical protein
MEVDPTAVIITLEAEVERRELKPGRAGDRIGGVLQELPRLDDRSIDRQLAVRDELDRDLPGSAVLPDIVGVRQVILQPQERSATTALRRPEEKLPLETLRQRAAGAAEPEGFRAEAEEDRQVAAVHRRSREVADQTVPQVLPHRPQLLESLLTARALSPRAARKKAIAKNFPGRSPGRW